MKNIYLLKIGELNLKGNNKKMFQNKLIYNIKKQIGTAAAVKITAKEGRFFLECDNNENNVEKTLSSVFGITGYSRAVKTDKDVESIKKAVLSAAENIINEDRLYTFKIDSRRSDKNFSYNSYELSSLLGSFLIDNFREKLKAKMKDPDFTINVEVRESAYIYSKTVRGPGGLPSGAAGKGLLLLSGGIDSPVAGYMMAKRGCFIEAIHFHTYPYTSEQSKEKVIKIAQKLADYLPALKLHIVPFTETQIHIKKNCKGEETTLLSRAAMMKIAHITAEKVRANCIITGECLSQVASQTAESIRFTGSLTDFPVFRPLSGFDKEEIVKIAENIGTFGISILPYDDCCSVFAPAKPLLKPSLPHMKRSYQKLELDDLIQKAAENTEIILIK